MGRPVDPQILGASRDGSRSPAGFDGRLDLAGWRLIAAVGRFRRALPVRRPSLVDLGMGRGRDLIYFARRGYRTLGIDRNPVNLAKARRRAARIGVVLNARLADLRRYALPRRFDVVYSSASLQYVPPAERARRFAHWQRRTVPGGLHAVNAVVAHPGNRPPPDMEPGGVPFRRGELRDYYTGWEILLADRFSLACAFGGRSHRHYFEELVARKPVRRGREPAPARTRAAAGGV